eukprot:CAMPEP_0117031124 /NCGR_PEP_ID=MMETSP0472-20121206/22409_1 /TAXON_ID=693140 ORGANISM="Tiarina fusus, Strain LIS" /NCGR_SAMPLE_ID=MMETSP0472 /ASSEMBLY_ACC=CAM_ASM_000603 /LENGTH=259 /DNA_ID=CAMNT_0004739389 /DNA_START=14 /DNA_END=793 /DNA_ORIENTATION=-
MMKTPNQQEAYHTPRAQQKKKNWPQQKKKMGHESFSTLDTAPETQPEITILDKSRKFDGSYSAPRNPLIQNRRRLRELPREDSVDCSSEAGQDASCYEARCTTPPQPLAAQRATTTRTTLPQQNCICSVRLTGMPSSVPARFESIQRNSSTISEITLPDLESLYNDDDERAKIFCDISDSPGKCMLQGSPFRKLLPRELSLELDDSCCEDERDEADAPPAPRPGMLLREGNFRSHHSPAVPAGDICAEKHQRRVFRFEI